MKATRAERAMVNRLPIPSPWSIEAFVEGVSTARKRPIVLVDQPADALPITGRVQAFRDFDAIYVRDDLVGLHREHVICHELGHILAGHTERPGADLIDADLAGAAAIILNRSCDEGDRREQEAEGIAELILRRVATVSRGGYAAGLI